MIATENEKQDIVTRFGGKHKVIEALKSKSIDDVYCWGNGRWYTQGYWRAEMDNNIPHVVLGDLVIAAKL